MQGLHFFGVPGWTRRGLGEPGKVRQEQGRTICVTHTLPRRAGEMDLRIDTTPSQQYFEAITYSVSIRMAIVASILGN